MAAQVFKKFVPLLDRVLVMRAVAETKTKGGVLLPERAQSKLQNAKVIAVGPGARLENGDFAPPSVNVGDEVLIPEFGGTKVNLDEEEYLLFRDGDILGKFSE